MAVVTTGLISWFEYIIAFVGEIWKHLFVITGHTFSWTQATPTGPNPPSAGQWELSIGNLPALTTKGEDIVAALMTIVHYGLIAVAQFVTLLPYNGTN